jgi:hypothetical protein
MTAGHYGGSMEVWLALVILNRFELRAVSARP